MLHGIKVDVIFVCKEKGLEHPKVDSFTSSYTTNDFHPGPVILRSWTML